jgi:cysteinyl-tRNA synthetase
MATSELGNDIDISMGGTDNLFNHHENTRAIADSLCGHEFSRYYVHVSHLMNGRRKMSKSKGTVVLLPDLLAKGMSAREVRMLLLSVHYRKRLNFTWQYAQGIKLRSLAMRKAINEITATRGEGRVGFDAFARDAQMEFEASLSDDMDVPSALLVAERFARECADAWLSHSQGMKALKLLAKFDSVLACLPV